MIESIGYNPSDTLQMWTLELLDHIMKMVLGWTVHACMLMASCLAQEDFGDDMDQMEDPVDLESLTEGSKRSSQHQSNAKALGEEAFFLYHIDNSFIGRLNIRAMLRLLERRPAMGSRQCWLSNSLALSLVATISFRHSQCVYTPQSRSI